MKRAFKNIVLAAVAAAVALLALETTLRTTHLFGARVSWTEPDAAIGWRFTPGREYWYRGENDHPVAGRINALGWRDRERSLAKPEGAYRICVVGDSFVEAFQVELESTFVAIAEREIDRRLDRPVEVMNLGRSGMSTAEELRVARYATEQMAADAIVLVFVPRNDIADVDPATADNPLRPFVRRSAGDSLVWDDAFSNAGAYRTRRRINACKQRSALVSLVAERYNAWRLARRSAAIAGAADDSALRGPFTLCTDSPDSVVAANYELCKRLIDEVATATRRSGARLWVTSVPLVYAGDDVARCRAANATFDPGFFDADLGAWAQSRGVDFVGLQEAFERHHRNTGERLHWAHWNYAGHRLVGGVLAGRVAASVGPVSSN